jgi:hypothetical protein
MKTSIMNPATALSRWMCFLGAMLIVALMVPAAAFSQPAAPVLATPTDNATNQPQVPTLIWNASTGVGTITYHLQVATNSGFTTGLQDFPGLTTTSQLITGLTVSTDYYWKVLAHDDGGFGSYSTPSKFTTWAAIPSPGPAPVTLGKTATFAILSYAGITDVPASAVTGDIGSSPINGSAIHLAQTEVTGTIFAVDATGPAGSVVAPAFLTPAMGDLTTAYNDAEGRTVNPIGLAGNIGGQTLYPGLYKSTGSLEITSGDLTLDGNGDATSVWIFQIASSFNMTSGRQVFLTNSAKASNVFWQVGSGATFGTTCVMKGTIMAATDITFATGATLEGRALAMTADVTLQQNTITNPGTINLKSAVTFGVLSADGISGTATVSGNVGTAAGTIGGGVTATTGNTKYPVGDAAVTTALTDLLAAYNDAAGRTDTAVLSATTWDLGSNTKTPGVYKIGTDAALTGTLTLNGAGIYIFQIGGNLVTATNSIVSLTNGAQWSDVFWQVGSSATLGTNSAFEGTIMANTSIQVNSGATMSARLLAGAVTSTGTIALNGNSVLPVELVSFTATANGMNTNLHWSTATEINNSGFEIQRRQASDWAKVGFVAGAGTSNSPRNYSYTDSKLSAGSYSYRLKQIDNNGAFRYGSTVEVAISSAPAAFALSQNYPNPFNPSTVISYSLEKAGMVSLRVYNMLGQEVATLVNGPQEAGVYTVSFNTNKGTLGLSSGVYVYRLEAGSFVSTKKLVLMK